MRVRTGVRLSIVRNLPLSGGFGCADAGNAAHGSASTHHGQEPPCLGSCRWLLLASKHRVHERPESKKPSSLLEGLRSGFRFRGIDCGCLAADDVRRLQAFGPLEELELDG